MPAKRDQDFFWEAVDRSELTAQQCSDCEKRRHPPAPACPHCGSQHFTISRLSGSGTIHSWIISCHPTLPDPNPKTVILVDLAEGLRFISNLIDAENIRIGAPVTVEFGEVNGRRLPLFRTVKNP